MEKLSSYLSKYDFSSSSRNTHTIEVSFLDLGLSQSLKKRASQVSFVLRSHTPPQSVTSLAYLNLPLSSPCQQEQPHCMVMPFLCGSWGSWLTDYLPSLHCEIDTISTDTEARVLRIKSGSASYRINHRSHLLELTPSSSPLSSIFCSKLTLTGVLPDNYHLALG